MSRSTWTSPRTPALLLLAHLIALWCLGRVDVLSQILGAARPNPIWLLVAVLFFQLRLVAVFVAPGWLMAALVGWALRRRAEIAPR